MAEMKDRLRLYDRARVLLLGHTGFVGGWLALWLRGLGAEVHGFALPPEDTPNLFDAIDLGARIESEIGDVRSRDAVVGAFRRSRPDVVFHLAAQSRVRRSYRMPVETLETNVMGTAHVLEGLRAVPGTRACVVVTSDKCYENQEREEGYREVDRLGGRDAYSASKACAELVISCYRRSLLADVRPAVLVASARAGNIVGGGDWAEDRIVPDCVRSIVGGEALQLRNPAAVRPWQHVLDAIHGYLLLGAHLLEGRSGVADAWNFGPDPDAPKPVFDLVTHFRREWGATTPAPVVAASSADGPVETGQLRLDSSKARRELGWTTRLEFEEAVRWTADWYRAFHRDHASMRAATEDQIRRYEARL